jgi:hypothetical protein
VTMKITVHHFEVYDIKSDAWRSPLLKSTVERIQRVDGRIVPGTAELVDAASLDEQRYDPTKNRKIEANSI